MVNEVTGVDLLSSLSGSRGASQVLLSSQLQILSTMSTMYVYPSWTLADEYEQ